MSKLAVIATGGKQYVVSPGKVLKIEKIEGELNDKVFFDKVLLLVDDQEEVTVGQPYIKNVKIEGTVISQARTAKKVLYKYKSKTRYRVKKGHRQHYTQVKITTF